MRGSGLSYVLVGVQFICLATLAFTGPIIPHAPLWALVTISGVLLGVWAVLAMRIPAVAVLPEVRRGAQLVTRGPYRVLRHPMYSALLVTGLGWVMGEPSLLRWLTLLVLLVNLVVKLNYEEGLLIEHFAEYAAYRRRTWRILPLIY